MGKMIAACVFAVIVLTAAIQGTIYLLKPKEAKVLLQKTTTTTIVNGGLIDGYEYHGDGIICYSQILVVPNAGLTYSNVTMDCVRE